MNNEDQNNKLLSIQWRIHLGQLSSKGDANYVERKINEQRQRYFQLVEIHPYPDLEEEKNDVDHDGSQERGNSGDPIETKQSSTQYGADLDPLTAIAIQEQEEKNRLHTMDLEFRKQRALQKRQQTGRGVAGGQPRRIMDDECEEYDQRIVTLQIIEKDLNRLPANDDETNDPHKRQWRKRLLTRVLYTWSCVYPTSGYLQGMHEIAYFILVALEREYNDIPTSQSIDPRNETNCPISTDIIQSNPLLTPADDAFQRIDEEELLVDVSLVDNSNSKTSNELTDPVMLAICADTYIISDWIIRSGLQSSYDLSLPLINFDDIDFAKQSSSFTASKVVKQPANPTRPLVLMAHRVMTNIGFQDPQLEQMLRSHSIPITLLLTKWVRVLFSREILMTTNTATINTPNNTNHTTNPNPDVVLKLWNSLFQAVHSLQERYSPITTCSHTENTFSSQVEYNRFMLNHVVEAFACARFLLHSHTIRQYLSLYDGTTDCLHWLMNIPPETPQNVQTWIQIMNAILKNVRITSSDLYQLLPMPSVHTMATPSENKQSFLQNGSYLHSQQHQEQQHGSYHGNRNTNSHLGNNHHNQENSPGFLGNAFSLLSIKDKLTHQTQSIHKRLQQEWESFQQHNQMQQQQQLQYNNSQPSFINSDGLVVPEDNNSQYNLEYHRPVFLQETILPHSDPNNAVHTAPISTTTTSTLQQTNNHIDSQSTKYLHHQPYSGINVSSSPTTANSSSGSKKLTKEWSVRLEQNVATLQHYMILIEQNAQVAGSSSSSSSSQQLPAELHRMKNRAWEALADLQVLSSDMKL